MIALRTFYFLFSQLPGCFSQWIQEGRRVQTKEASCCFVFGHQ